MIAAMDQITVVGRRSIANELLTSLQSLGVVQVDPLEPGEDVGLERLELSDKDRELKEGWDAAVSRADSLIDALGIEEIKPASRTDVPKELKEIKSQLETIGKQVDALVAERGELRDELDVAETYLPLFRELAPMLAQLDGSRYLTGTAFAVPSDNVKETLDQIEEELNFNVVFSRKERAKDELVVVAVMNRQGEDLKVAISHAGYNEIVLPDMHADMGIAKATHLMEERSQSAPKRLETIDQELEKLSEQHGPKLATMSQIAHNHQARYERLEDMAEGRYSFALRGWMPTAENNKVVEGLRKQFGEDLIVETRHADEHHDYNVPVRLDNPGWVKPFEGLLALFAPPKYGNFDPSWTLAVFFPFFFGLVVGDMGFGFAFAALALWMRQRGQKGEKLSLGPLGVTISSKALAPVSTVILWCAVWSVLFGFAYGEFFGNFLEHWPENRPIFYVPGHGAEGAHGAEAAVADGLTDNHGGEAVAEPAAESVAAADAHGEEAAHGGGDDHGEEGGHAEGLIPILLFRVERYTPLLLASLGFGILQVLGGWGIRVFYGFKHHDMKHVWEGVGMIGGLVGLIVFSYGYLTNNINPIITGILIGGMVIFLLGMVLSRVFLMIIELASNAGAILSYLRLFAVGLSAALVANLATDLGFAISGFAPIIGPIIGIVVALAVHTIAIALTIIGHTLQPLRLNYVEFFTKFGYYDESGRAYSPFRLLGGKS